MRDVPNENGGIDLYLDLLMRNDETSSVFTARLDEPTVRSIAGLNFELKSKEIMDVATALKDWPTPVVVASPDEGFEITAAEILLDDPLASPAAHDTEDMPENLDAPVRKTTVRFGLKS